jgi:hypothetical protein
VFASEAPGTVPLYRFTNPQAKHFYTTHKWEGEAKEGYKLENITAYVYPAQSSGGPVVIPGNGPTIVGGGSTPTPPPSGGPSITPGPRTDVTPGNGGNGPTVTTGGRTEVTSNGGRTVTLTPR